MGGAQLLQALGADDVRQAQDGVHLLAYLAVLCLRQEATRLGQEGRQLLAMATHQRQGGHGQPGGLSRLQLEQASSVGTAHQLRAARASTGAPMPLASSVRYRPWTELRWWTLASLAHSATASLFM